MFQGILNFRIQIQPLLLLEISEFYQKWSTPLQNLRFQNSWNLTFEKVASEFKISSQNSTKHRILRNFCTCCQEFLTAGILAFQIPAFFVKNAIIPVKIKLCSRKSHLTKKGIPVTTFCCQKFLTAEIFRKNSAKQTGF